MLSIADLSKTYDNGVQALKGISLEIPPGMYGLLGPNGAGKSTLMRTIATLQEPDQGSIRFGDLNVLADKTGVRRILGYLPQEFGTYPKVSAEALLDHFAMLKGLRNGKQRKETVKRLLQLTNLYDVRKKALGGYSGGMKQRFGIAQALLGDPKLVIVDEPTAGLDPEERNRFHNLLCELGRDMVIILSTHIVSDVADLCSNMAIINKGEVLLQGDPEIQMTALEGKVWAGKVPREEAQALLDKLPVISSRQVGHNTLIHTYADSAPQENFKAVTPTLEDVYFATIKGFYKG